MWRAVLFNGSLFARICRFDLKVNGKGGHGGVPQGTVDAVVVAASLVMNMQTMYVDTSRPRPHTHPRQRRDIFGLTPL